MELEITPEPSAEERAAIEAAVAALYAGLRETRSAWWHAGVIDAVEEDDAQP
jgi:hypothetical protein